MEPSKEELLSSVLRLPIGERAHFVRKLLASLDEEEDTGAEEEWVREVERRAEESFAGTAETEPWEEVRARVSARLRRGRQT
jgi:putative addiction module component (TIGR02574 family)